jgi:hypothetical protein
MQCTSYYRDPFETAAWQLYLRECALRTAREEVAFLEAVGGATKEELERIKQRVMASEAPAYDASQIDAMAMNNARLLSVMAQSQVKPEPHDMWGQDVMAQSQVKPEPHDMWGQDPHPQHDHNNLTVSLKSVLADVIDSDTAVNSLCRRVRPMLEQHGIATFKKHQAVHVLRVDTQRVRGLGLGLI